MLFVLHPKIIIFEEQTKIPDTFVSGILFLFQMGFLDSLILNYFASVPKLAFYERVF